jgi:hypothetical protein
MYLFCPQNIDLVKGSAEKSRRRVVVVVVLSPFPFLRRRRRRLLLLLLLRRRRRRRFFLGSWARSTPTTPRWLFLNADISGVQPFDLTRPQYPASKWGEIQVPSASGVFKGSSAPLPLRCHSVVMRRLLVKNEIAVGSSQFGSLGNSYFPICAPRVLPPFTSHSFFLFSFSLFRSSFRVPSSRTAWFVVDHELSSTGFS